MRTRIGNAGSMAQRPMIEALNKLSLTTNLKLCLDAGDSNSYASGQKWLDVSGNGYDFFFGVDATTTNDPVFSGTAGDTTASEYMTVAGSNGASNPLYFKYDTTNEAWMDNIHKDNAKFSIVCWMSAIAAGPKSYPIASSSEFLNTTGFGFYVASSSAFDTDLGVLRFNACNADGIFKQISTTARVPASAWNFVAVSLDEAVGTGGALLRINSTTETFSSTYTAPAAIAASKFLIGRMLGSFSSNEKMGAVCMWEGVALTDAQLTQIFNATRGRFGV